MRSSKPRLYLAVYSVRGSPALHFALHVTPKIASPNALTLDSRKYHCKQVVALDHYGKAATTWAFEAASVNSACDSMLLARILLGKLHAKTKELEDIMFGIPVDGNDRNFDDGQFVRLALMKLKLEGLCGEKSKLDWFIIQERAIEYVQEKRIQGRLDLGKGPVPTYDMTTNEELVP